MLILTFSGMEEGSLRRLSNLTDEYAQDILVGGSGKRSYRNTASVF